MMTGVLQAMEAPGERFVIGVQRHPETADDCGVFKGLMEAAHSFQAVAAVTSAGG
jgi:putative glutamine amidotransferase